MEKQNKQTEEKKGKYLKCTKQDCQHEWLYKGNSRFYVTCPMCYRKLKVNLGEENYKDNKEKIK